MQICRFIFESSGKCGYNTTFGGEVPKVPQWTGPPLTTVTTQALLYLSLMATLASALLVILIKHLLSLHTLADTRGPYWPEAVGCDFMTSKSTVEGSLGRIRVFPKLNVEVLSIIEITTPPEHIPSEVFQFRHSMLRWFGLANP